MPVLYVWSPVQDNALPQDKWNQSGSLASGNDSELGRRVKVDKFAFAVTRLKQNKM